MGFSGQMGRVIETPRKPRARPWRTATRRGGDAPDGPPRQPVRSTPSPVTHRTQPWFHGGISREESQRITEQQQGLVDGRFLSGDGKGSPKAFVLTLGHHQKLENFRILPCEDDGNTKSSDPIQLVDFYQLNKGVLPCKLKHQCIRVAL